MELGCRVSRATAHFLGAGARAGGDVPGEINVLVSERKETAMCIKHNTN
jgi:hypothetical protein